MRNLVQYPITAEETLKAFDGARQALRQCPGPDVAFCSVAIQNAPIGGADDYALSLLGNFLKSKRKDLEAFLEDAQRMDGI